MDVSIITDTTHSSLTFRISVEDVREGESDWTLMIVILPFSFILGALLLCRHLPLPRSQIHLKLQIVEPLSQVVLLVGCILPALLFWILVFAPVATSSSLSSSYFWCPLLPTCPHQTQDSGSKTSFLDS